jgi:hypothetical protein
LTAVTPTRHDKHRVDSCGRQQFAILVGMRDQCQTNSTPCAANRIRIHYAAGVRSFLTQRSQTPLPTQNTPASPPHRPSRSVNGCSAYDRGRSFLPVQFTQRDLAVPKAVSAGAAIDASAVSASPGVYLRAVLNPTATHEGDAIDAVPSFV